MGESDLLQAMLFVTASMLFFMTLLYIAASPVDGETRAPGWWKPKQPPEMCKLHQRPRAQCKPEEHE